MTISSANELAAEHRKQLLAEFMRNRRVAHEVLFRHRHPLRTPSFHLQMIDAHHGPLPKVVIEAFRDAAKSTVAEEAIVIGSLMRDFRNAVIIGASYPRAKERLTAIKNELVVNRAVNQLFGSVEGDTVANDDVEGPACAGAVAVPA